LYKYGLSSAPVSVSVDDGLTLKGARITNAVKCLPPENKPLPAEIARCNHYLKVELEQSPEVRVIVALGKIAHDATLKAHGLKVGAKRFAHGAEHELDGRLLIDSYHCSRYNTQTRRLTAEMFEAVIRRAAELSLPKT
jgi:uracil-DNA glycosylase family 4